nr:hypothetical protein [uncultured Rhodopila sp.]
MPETTSVRPLSVAALFADREARRRRDIEAEKQLQQQQLEELADFRRRLDSFQITDEVVKSTIDKIRKLFEAGETELMLTSFPSSFCTDSGRAIINAGAPPIVELTEEERAALPDEPEWLATMPLGVRKVYDYWKENLKPGGFEFSARIINYPDGKPGDVGLFFAWPKSALEA